MPGGVGLCKASGNYEISLKAKELVKEGNCADALFLDGKTETHIEELGAANVFIVKDNILYTPLLRDTILAGITRKSIITLATKELGLKTYEKDIFVEKHWWQFWRFRAPILKKADEVFASGTAAVITPIGQIKDRGTFYTIADGEVGIITRKLYELLTGIQYGEIPDKFHWLVAVK